MNPVISIFLKRILLFVGITFGAHLFLLNFLELPLYDNKIVLAYIVNTIFAIAVFIFLFSFQRKFKNQLGFLFILGSMIKFGIFFLLFFSSYKEDGIISKVEFFAFAVPYVVTLVVEVFYLSKWLNKMK